MAISQPISGIGGCYKWEILFFYKTSNFDMGSFAQFQVPRESVVSTYQVYGSSSSNSSNSKAEGRVERSRADGRARGRATMQQYSTIK